MGESKVVSVYEGFFNGGARIVHTDVLLGLHRKGMTQSVATINSAIFREHTLQRMEDDSCYRRLTAADIAVISLGRTAGNSVDYSPFTREELTVFNRQIKGASAILSLKEQPMRLIHQAGTDIPAIVCLHRSDPDERAMRQLQASRVAAFITCSKIGRDAYVATGLPAEKVHHIPNGIDLGRFRPSSLERARVRSNLGIEDTAPVITLAARYDPVKNIGLFLASAQRYLARTSDATVLMCGAGMTAGNPDLRIDMDKAFSDTPELRRRVRLLDIRDDTPAILTASDVVALTSRIEAHPLSLIEGLASGAVPVTTNVGDTPDIVAEGRGILTTDDPAAIADAWQYAYDNRSEFLAAIAATRHQFGQDHMVDAYGEVIAQYMG